MDAVTHALLGATIAEASFRGRLGGKAVFAAAALAMLPDADVITGRFGPWNIIKYHRGPTHSLIVLAVVAPVLGWLLWRIFRKRGSFASWSILAFAAMASNPVLDGFTTFGTQLLWPITNHRFAIDAVAIIDPAFTIWPTLAVIVACVPRLRAFSRKFAPAMLVVAAAYLASGLALTLWANSTAARQLEAEGFRVERSRACPEISAPLLRRIVASDAEGNLRVGFVSMLVPRPIRFEALDRPKDPLVAKALASDTGKLFQWFADGYLAVLVERRADGGSVLIEDERYGWITRSPHSFFGALAEFDASGNLMDVRPAARREQVDRWAEIRAGWRLTFGKSPMTSEGTSP